MKLYSVYYYGNAMDKDVPLPEPTPDIKQVVNTNWGGEVLEPRKDGAGNLYWHCTKHGKNYLNCSC